MADITPNLSPGDVIRWSGIEGYRDGSGKVLGTRGACAWVRWPHGSGSVVALPLERCELVRAAAREGDPNG